MSELSNGDLIARLRQVGDLVIPLSEAEDGVFCFAEDIEPILIHALGKIAGIVMATLELSAAARGSAVLSSSPPATAPAHRDSHLLKILAAIAEFERERIGEHIRDAKRRQRRSRQYLGVRLAGGRWGPAPARCVDANSIRRGLGERSPAAASVTVDTIVPRREERVCRQEPT